MCIYESQAGVCRPNAVCSAINIIVAHDAQLCKSLTNCHRSYTILYIAPVTTGIAAVRPSFFFLLCAAFSAMETRNRSAYIFARHGRTG